jgi:hypothetical protein
MPNGRWTTMNVGQLKIESGEIAVLDPVVFGDLLGIDHVNIRRALTELAKSQRAFHWHTIGHTYRVLQHDHDEGFVSYEVFP